VVQSGEVFRCENDAGVELGDGTRLPVHFSASPINDAAGKTLGIALVVHDDSARRSAAQALQESERKFRTLAESTNAAILVYRDKFLYVNAAAERFSGYTQDELLQKSLLDLVHPEHRGLIAARLRERMAGDDTTQNYQIRILTKSGSECWVEISAGMVEYEGMPAGVATAFDITHHMTTVAALRASDQQLSAIMDNTGAAIYIKDMDGRKIMVNKEMERILGLPREAIIGKLDSELFPKEVADELRTNDLRVAAAPGPLIFEETFLLQACEHDYISVKVPLRDADGKVYAICGISTDITLQKRKERGMLKFGPWTQRLLDISTDEDAFYREVSAGIVDLVDADIGAMPCLDESGANFTYRGAAGAHASLLMGQSMPVLGGGLCGWVATHGQPLNVPDLFADARVLPGLARALDVDCALVVPLIQNRTVIGGLSAFRKGRHFDAVDLELLTLYGQRVALALSNLRLMQSLEQRVAERTAQLATSNAELEAFSYSVSHDLRAPLRSIEGFSQALVEDCGAALDERGRDYLQRVRNGAARMSELIDDLLALSRVSRSAMIRGPVDLSALATTVVQTLQARAPQRRVSIEVVPGLSAVGDARLLQIALENLLGNAWKFTRKQPQAHIEFGVTEQDGMPVYYVRDNGAGFDMAHAAKLFGAFERLHADSDFEGTGIGLATVRRVIQRHGGKVWAEGKPGQGATFYFTL
jgi:PAS domain S-box-containing protein